MRAPMLVLLRCATFAATAALAVGSEASTTIYRCVGADGGVLYTDVPCPGGRLVELRPGEADPAAVERLAREARAASERFVQQRAALAAAEEAQRRSRASYVPEPPPAPPEGTYCEWCGGWFAYPPVPPPPKPPPRRPLRYPQGFVPAR